MGGVYNPQNWFTIWKGAYFKAYKKLLQSLMGLTHSATQMLIVLYLFKCLYIKKLYFRVQIGRQILTCNPNPKNAI
jgi:hypothetical protein